MYDRRPPVSPLTLVLCALAAWAVLIGVVLGGAAVVGWLAGVLT
jgi:hypothetical protein